MIRFAKASKASKQLDVGTDYGDDGQRKQLPLRVFGLFWPAALSCAFLVPFSLTRTKCSPRQRSSGGSWQGPGIGAPAEGPARQGKDGKAMRKTARERQQGSKSKKLGKHNRQSRRREEQQDRGKNSAAE